MEGNIVMQSVEEQFLEVSQKFVMLILEQLNDKSHKIFGTISFHTIIDGFEINDAFDIEIAIPQNYPEDLPSTKETKYKVPRTFHRNNDDTLCLETPLELRKLFNIQPNLIGYIENCLIPYLAAFHYHQKKGKMPFGERKHGGEGIIESYRETLLVSDEYIIYKFIKYLSANNYRGHEDCLCKSGKKLRNCHGKLMLELMMMQSPKWFEYELNQVVLYLNEKKSNITKEEQNDRKTQRTPPWL